MKNLLLLFCLTAAGLFAQPATINLGSRGQLTLFFSGDWDITGTEMGGQATLTINGKGSVNATCTIAVSFPEKDVFNTKARLKQRVEVDAMTVAEGSVEGKPAPREFTLTSGFGFYCSITDASLRGKPPEKGNYKVASFGKIRLAPDVLVDVQIMADGFRDAPYQELLGAIEGMEYKR